MKIKNLIAVGLTVAALASCTIVPTVLAGQIVHESGIYECRPKGYILTQMQGYVTATLSGYPKTDCFLIQDRQPGTIARRTYNTYNGRRAYYTYYANKSSHIKDVSYSMHSW